MASGEPSFADIAPVWHSVATLLSARDLCNCIQASKQLKHLSDVEAVWKSAAHRTWQQLANPDMGGYTSYKALVLDDNRQNLALSMALREVSCMWRYQRPAHLYYECKLLQLQWWRSDNTLRLYFDARGEADLRSPITSSLAIVALKTPVGSPSDPHGASGRRGGAADGAGQQQQQQTDAAVAGDPACWSKKMGVFYPDACQLLTNKRGHYKGVLIWSSYQCSKILDLLLPSPQRQQQQQQQQHLHQLPQAPLPQHMHQQRARRSEAFEEWADWQLTHQDDVNAAVGGPPVMRPAAGSPASETACTSSPTSGSTGQRTSSSSSGHGGGVSSSSSNSSASHGGWLDGLEKRLMSQLGNICGRDGGNSSSSSSSIDGPAAPVSQSIVSSRPPSTSAGAMVASVRQEQPQQLALVFCYSNNLAEADGAPLGLPDYSIEPLLVVPPDQPAGTSKACAGATAVGAVGADAGGGAVTQPTTTIIPEAAADPPHAAVVADGIALEGEGGHVPVVPDHDEYFLQHLQLLHVSQLLPPHNHPHVDAHIEHPIHALDMGFPGLLFPHMPGPAPYNLLRVPHMNTDWVPPVNAAAKEGRWAAEWLKLPSAAFAARGTLHNEMQDETEDDEVVRWFNLPEAVKRRGKAWWV